MEVDAPVAGRADALADFLALGDDAVDGLARVVDAADRDVGGAHAERPIAGVHGRLRAVVQRDWFRASRRRRHERRPVTLTVVAHRAAEQLVHGQLERLALDVPERQVHRADGVRLLAPRRIEPGDEHLLPDRLDAERILADERAGALLERVFRSALADAGDPDVGLDGADHVALIEELIEIRRFVDSDPRDLRARQLSLGKPRAQQHERRRRGQGLEEGSSFHAGEDMTVDSRESRVGRLSRESESASESESESAVRVGSPIGSPSRQSESAVRVGSPSRQSESTAVTAAG